MEITTISIKGTSQEVVELINGINPVSGSTETKEANESKETTKGPEFDFNNLPENIESLIN